MEHRPVHFVVQQWKHMVSVLQVTVFRLLFRRFRPLTLRTVHKQLTHRDSLSKIEQS